MTSLALRNRRFSLRSVILSLTDILYLAGTKGRLPSAISDSGIGMTEEVQKHIFDKIYQGDTSRKTEGSGLGLALVHKIAELCGGTVSVKSTPGEGSQFTVTLPL